MVPCFLLTPNFLCVWGNFWGHLNEVVSVALKGEEPLYQSEFIQEVEIPEDTLNGIIYYNSTLL